MSGDEFIELKEKIKEIEERITAIEKEQRTIREDILSGRAKERMQQRILENTQKNIEELKKKIDSEIKIEI
jgi:septation ring formation regulator EzrA